MYTTRPLTLGSQQLFHARLMMEAPVLFLTRGPPDLDTETRRWLGTEGALTVVCR